MANMWDDRFSASEFIFGKSPSQFVEKFANHLKPNSKIYLPADGEGRNSCYLASLGHETFASDYSVVGQEKAKKLAAELGVNVHFQSPTSKMIFGLKMNMMQFLQFSFNFHHPKHARVFLKE